MYRVEYRPEADKDLERLDKVIRKRIIKKVHWLAKNVEEIRHEMLGGGYKGLYKLRIGDWRVIYEIRYPQKLLVVYTVGHRKEIYRK
ncbi:hypothetical protein ES703_12228 [subsurface metagenome]